MLDGYEHYNVDDWDGYGAKPVEPKTLETARLIASLLKNAPDAAPGGDGSICFEWVSGRDKIFLDVSGEHISFYGQLAGVFFTTNKPHLR